MLPRRLAFLLLCLTLATLAPSAVAWTLGADGLSGLDLAVLAVLALLGPWLALGLGHALLGLALLLRHANPAAAVLPAASRAVAPRGRTAIAVCLRDEDMEAVLPPLARLLDGLPLASFDLWFLSDTQTPAGITAEDAAIDGFRAGRADGARVHLRRRATNAGFKAGNVMEFLDAEGAAYDHLICLDADSEMSAAAVLRLAGIMEADPRIGIVQQLIVGRPAASPFARLFQFGMRAGMRVWATAQAWWQGPKGPYWGHNAILRVTAFRAQARLAPLPDGSAILSHDQVEAIRLHEAGWGVWCWPEEAGSMEGNPPALPEFLQRDERWAAGNMQYLQLIREPGLGAMSRWQLAQAIYLFAAAPLWALLFALAVLEAATGGLDAVPGPHLAGLAAAFFLAIAAPRLAGIAQVLLRGTLARRYGGRARVLAGAALEVAFTLLLAPISTANKSRFLLALLFGTRTGWRPQNRADRGVGWADAARLLWWHSALGWLAFAVLAATAPWALSLFLLWGGGLLVAIPFCVLTAAPGFGRWLVAHRLAATPEELAATQALRLRARSGGPESGEGADPSRQRASRAGSRLA